MEKKWTRGPWKIERYKEPFTATIDDINITADGLILAKLGKELSPEYTANAHLIAAVPELYEALEDIVEYVSSIFTSTELNNLCKEARKALAKARGETGEMGE